MKIFFLLFSFTSLVADVASARSFSSRFDQILYNETFQDCSMKGSDRFILTHGMRFVESMESSWKQFSETALFQFDQTVQAFKDRGLSPTTAVLLQSEGFYFAIQDCFPNNESSQHQYVFNMILADTLGRAVGSIQGYFTIRGVSVLTKGLFNGAGAILKLSRWGEKAVVTIETHPKTSIAVVAAAAMALNVHHQLAETRVINLRQRSVESDYGISLKKMYNQIQVLLRRRTFLTDQKALCDIDTQIASLKDSYVNL